MRIQHAAHVLAQPRARPDIHPNPHPGQVLLIPNLLLHKQIRALLEAHPQLQQLAATPRATGRGGRGGRGADRKGAFAPLQSEKTLGRVLSQKNYPTVRILFSRRYNLKWSK